MPARTAGNTATARDELIHQGVGQLPQFRKAAGQVFCEAFQPGVIHEDRLHGCPSQHQEIEAGVAVFRFPGDEGRGVRCCPGVAHDVGHHAIIGGCLEEVLDFPAAHDQARDFTDGGAQCQAFADLVAPWFVSAYRLNV